VEESSQTDSLAEENLVFPNLSLDSTFFSLAAIPSFSYSENRNWLARRRVFWAERYKQSVDSLRGGILDSAGKDLETGLVSRFFPFWYGTPWDFNGYTNVPGEGTVACGYFVSTTLKHAGFNLNRYRLAQKSAKEACMTLKATDSIWHLQPANTEEFRQSCSGLKEGLYTIGLDYHIGYLLIRKGRFFFIHSSFVGTDGVTLEPIEDSPAFLSTGYYLNAITCNPSLIRVWLENTPLN